MKRNQTIASIAVASGIVLAGSVATIAVVQATASSDDREQVLQVATTTSPQPDIAFTPEPLPALPTANAQATTASSETASTLLTQRQSEQAALSATRGRVLSSAFTERNGVSATAVKISRTDGSVVTAYVDRNSGVVFDWVVNTKAPAQPAGPTATDEDDRTSDEDSDDDHDKDDHDHDKDDDHKDDHDGDHDDD